MAGINDAVLNRAFKEYEKYIIDCTRNELSKWCLALVKAAVERRLGDYNAHNFTGNLLNSIVVCLYENGKPQHAWYSSETGGVRGPIMGKMSPQRRKAYYFGGGDYDGSRSYFKPVVNTDGGYGADDARKFFEGYKPDGNNLFDIVVAYTVEYADFVQQQRNTTGILETHGYARHTGMTFMKIAS